MHRFKLLLLLLFCVLHTYGQQIPFQGRLSENGVPINGLRTFQFSINVGTVNWSETHNNVVVTNGLYALVLGQNNTLPANLFAAQNSVPLAITVGGQSLPITTLYAPFESDPTVPAHVKDGISWEEISNKPSLDQSESNELQTLSTDGSNISISGGNSVPLPNFSNPTETFAVGTQETTNLFIVDQLSFDGSVVQNSAWQSFFVEQNADLQAIHLDFANSANVNIRLRIYPGVGTATQSVFDVTYNAGQFSSGLGIQVFDVAGQAAVDLAGGTTYTFLVSGVGGNLTFRRDTNNPYIGGRAGLAAATDLVFKINVNQSTEYALSVTPALTTLNTPLEVNDRIKDKTGFVMPVGAVVPYAGATPPEGWLLCDGLSIDRDDYAELFSAIGTAWGVGDGSTSFNVPDLRGIFLRGVSGPTNWDPEKDSRGPNNGGNGGNDVGSYQGDGTRLPDNPMTGSTDSAGAHAHTVATVNSNDPGPERIPTTQSTPGGNTYSTSTAGAHTHTLTISSGGDSHTRPRNAYVHFIIKY